MRNAERPPHKAVEDAGKLLAEYARPGERNGQHALDRLMAVLDCDAVGEALERLKEK
jgi:hypothetical protein